MPELPEVETTVIGLNKHVKNNKIISIWSDYSSNLPMYKNSLKNKKYFEKFKSKVLNQKILNARRIAKNILIELENNILIHIHLKMTGHLLYGYFEYNKPQNKWIPIYPESLKDPFNRFIHFVICLSNGKKLAMSDARKFGSIRFFENLEEAEKHLGHFGPDPFEEISAEDFRNIILKRPNHGIKRALLDQTLISGIGNIYSDEILFEAEIHPESMVKNLSQKKFKRILSLAKKILAKSISLGGDSMQDFRNLMGEKGGFQNHHKAYKKSGFPCPKRGCTGKILRKKINGRSAHFCSVHQVLYK